jgi:hypothetical protein
LGALRVNLQVQVPAGRDGPGSARHGPSILESHQLHVGSHLHIQEKIPFSDTAPVLFAHGIQTRKFLLIRNQPHEILDIHGHGHGHGHGHYC